MIELCQWLTCIYLTVPVVLLVIPTLLVASRDRSAVLKANGRISTASASNAVERRALTANALKRR